MKRVSSSQKPKKRPSEEYSRDLMKDMEELIAKMAQIADRIERRLDSPS